MYPVFPTLALVRSSAGGISVRQAAREIGISHTYLSELEDFVIVPPPDMQTHSGLLLFTKAKEIILNMNIDIETEQFSLESDNAFFSLRQSLWNNLLKEPNSSVRGPLLSCLLRCYFCDREDGYNNGVVLFLPHKSSMEPLLPDIIANFCERYYSAESFRRRKPRGWKLVPPFFKRQEDFGVTFTNSEDSREIFNSHPSSYYFAMFLLYSLLKGVNISISGINCSTNNLPEEMFNKYESCYEGYNYYARFSKYSNSLDTTIHICKAKFTLTPPAFRALNIFEQENHKRDYPFIPVPEKTVIHVCLTDPFLPSTYCWCLAPES